MNMDFEKKLAIPMEVKEMYPISAHLAEIVDKRAAELKAIFDGTDDRLLLIIGPCSADREDSVLEYVSRLREVTEGFGLSVLLEVDGGITPATAPPAIAAGANVLVAGSAVFGKPDRKAAIAALRGEI